MASKKRKVRHSDLSTMKKGLKIMAQEANQRASQLTITNPAYVEAIRTKPKSRKSSELFAENLVTRQQVMREISRIQQFTADWAATPEGAEYYEEEKETVARREALKGQFGGQWMKETGETYNTNVINSDYAEQAFDLYRRLVEEEGEDRAKMLWNRDSAKISYGSENMIIAIYDMLVMGAGGDQVMDFARVKMAENELELNRQLFPESFDYGRLESDQSTNDRKKGAIDAIADKLYF